MISIRPARILAPALLMAASAVALPAQKPVAPTPLTPGVEVFDSIAPETTHAYALDLPTGQFVLGEVSQRTVDVAVTVRGPAGHVIRRFDGSERGRERIHFDGGEAGTYRLEVESDEDGTGGYSLRIDRVEPVAVDAAERVDQLMAPFAGGVPGGVVGVVRGGELVFARGYGMANLTHHIPFTAGTRANIGSTSKQFTAFAIALLDRQGRLSLDDDVRTYIPELPAFDATVTLRHLLTHTSGYREFLNLLALSGRRIDRGDYIDRSEIIQVVQRQPELQNAPGAEWNYNNTAFALLAMVVERVTGTPFPEWMRENVFEPLDMHQTVVRAEPSQIIENSAQGYIPTPEGEYREAPDLAGAMGAGGIYTTVADLAKWVRNLETGELGGRAIVDAMTTPYTLTTGDTTDYGLGLFIDEFRGVPRIHHGGADIAHRSMLAYYPESRIGVVTLSNFAGFPGTVANEVAAAYLGDVLEPSDDATAAGAVAAQADPVPFDPTGYDPVSFDEFAGRYSLDEMPSFVLSFFREGDTLYTQATGQPRIRIAPASDSTFTLVGVPASVTFHRGDDGEVTHATLHQNGDHRATRIDGDQWSPSEADLAAYTGRYYSEELETYYTLSLEDGSLVVKHRRFEEGVELQPGEEDAFTGSFPIGTARFERDEDGQVTTLFVENVRARDVRFERVR